MAEYSELTGRTVKWQRVLVAGQKEHVERWREHYPAPVTKPATSSSQLHYAVRARLSEQTTLRDSLA